MKKKIALITGITGQDGSYLSKFLLKKKYVVHGIKRRTSIINTKRIDDIYLDKHVKSRNLILHYGDITDSSNINNLLSQIKPDEVYNLAAQSHVKVSFETPVYTTSTNAIGTLNILEGIKSNNLINKTKFYQASSSEMFGNIKRKSSISEKDFFEPVSPYASSKLFSYWITRNYRNAYNMHASNGILFNHEGPERGETFVTRKITMHVAKKFKGSKKILYLGNINSYRDWGHAEDYVRAMWLMLQQKKSDDYVIATNKSYSVKDFANKAFECIGIKLKWLGKKENAYAVNQKNGEVMIKIDKSYFRPNELEYLRGNFSKARKILGWKPKKGFNTLVKEMVENDIKKIQ